MKVLVVGKGGQLATELELTCPEGITLLLPSLEQFDLCQTTTMAQYFADKEPDLVINAAAYTAVDQAESEPELAYAVNRDGVKSLAQCCQTHGARLIHISTDFVFDGRACSPYLPNSQANPLGVYGASKREGELAVLEVMLESSLVIRTSWLYSQHGSNFVKTMLKLMNTRDALRVVSDQVGTPTWAKNLAEAIWQAAHQPDVCGMHHFSDLGVASWYDFAVAVSELGQESGALSSDVALEPIASEAYPTPAQRPLYSVLDTQSTRTALGIKGQHWRAALADMLKASR